MQYFVMVFTSCLPPNRHFGEFWCLNRVKPRTRAKPREPRYGTFHGDAANCFWLLLIFGKELILNSRHLKTALLQSVASTYAASLCGVNYMSGFPK